MTKFQMFIFLVIGTSTFFLWDMAVNAHPIDIHIPTSHDYLFEMEYERMRANQEAEKVLADPDASREELDGALDQLYGPNGNRA
jgi:hypothetical protein